MNDHFFSNEIFERSDLGNTSLLKFREHLGKGRQQSIAGCTSGDGSGDGSGGDGGGDGGDGDG